MPSMHQTRDVPKEFASSAPTYLRCDMREGPLGIARRRPTFTWQLPRGTKFQTAYQLQLVPHVAQFAASLDCWDVGKVEGTDSLHVPYDGPELQPATTYYWRVRTWDENGRPSPFSKPASFVTGLWDGFTAHWIWSEDRPEKNQHVLFRQRLQLGAGPIRRALAFVSADDYYKLYVNGQFVGQGPAPGYPHIEYHYNTFDITPYIAAGKPLCIVAHAYYQGLQNYVWVSGDDRRGFICEVHVEFGDGTVQRVCTDETWRALTVTAFHGRHLFGWETGFNEDIDARRLPVDWQRPEFDASDWPGAIPVKKADWRLHPQETEPLHVYGMKPVRVVEKAHDHYFFDFGREIVGTVRVGFRGRDGATARLRLGEELEGPDSVRYNLRANCLYEDVWTLRDGEQQLELYDYRGFRYGEVVGPGQTIDPDSIAAIVRHYPADPMGSRFESSDQELNALWELAKYSIIMGSQEVYMDCPTREKANYSLDTYLQMSAAYYLTGEVNLGRRSTELLLQSAPDGKLRCLGPAARDHFFTEYALYPVLMAWRYYMYTADMGFLDRNYGALARVARYFEETFSREDGLLEGTDAVLRDLVDWPMDRRDGHEILAVNIVPNSVYYRVLKDLEQIAALVGDSAGSKRFAARADQVRKAINTRLWDEANRRYLDGIGKEGRSHHSSLHANVFPLAMGVVPSERVPEVVAFIKTRGLNCNTFLAMFLFEALYDHGAADYAYKLLTADGEDSPMHMVREGATTTWEAWALDQKWNTSLFHPATAFTAYIMASRMMGVTPLAPGFRRIRVKPQLVEVEEAAIQIPTPYGPVRLHCRQRVQNYFSLSLEIPPNTTAQVYVPRVGSSTAALVLDGTVHPARIEGDWLVLDSLSPGWHRVATGDMSTP